MSFSSNNSFNSQNSLKMELQDDDDDDDREEESFFSAYATFLGEDKSSVVLASNSFRPRVSTMPSASTSSYSSTSSSYYSPTTQDTAAVMHVRPRRPSVSDQTMTPHMYRVRSYSVTSKGVTKCGETVRIRHNLHKGVTGSNFSLGSSTGANGGSSSTSCISSYSSPRHRSWSYGSSASSSCFSEVNSVNRYRVVVMGAADVGKSSLISQFVTSDFQSTTSNQEMESKEKSVSIMVDGEEAELEFSAFKSTSDLTPDECVINDDVDAYVIVYSVADRKSFNAALRSIKLLQATDLLQDKAVILVGNKIDLERCRSISTAEGREAATSCGCKFIETSDWMHHNVDELMVGILNQIRLKQQQRTKRHESKLFEQQQHGGRRSRSRTLHSSSTTSSSEEHVLNYRRSRSVVKDFFRKINFTSRSCDNLHVL